MIKGEEGRNGMEAAQVTEQIWTHARELFFCRKFLDCLNFLGCCCSLFVWEDWSVGQQISLSNEITIVGDKKRERQVDVSGGFTFAALTYCAGGTEASTLIIDDSLCSLPALSGLGINSTISHTFLHYLSSRIPAQLHKTIGTIHDRIAVHLCVAKHKVGICNIFERKKKNKKMKWNICALVMTMAATFNYVVVTACPPRNEFPAHE